MTLPAMIILFFILIIPMVYTVYCSTQSLRYLQFGDFVGIENYRSLLRDKDVISSFGRTCGITFGATAISMVIGLLLALWIHNSKGVFAYLIQMIGLIPWVISMVVGALLWRWLLNSDMGLINYLVTQCGFSSLKVFINKEQAISLLIFVLAWRTIGYSMVMILAGFKGVSDGLIEAAHVDGANGFQTLLHVQMPLVKTQMLISAIVLTMSNFNNNTVPMVLTSGGPGKATNVISLFLYKLSFTYSQFGKASALAVMLLLVNLIMTIIYVRVVKYEI